MYRPSMIVVGATLLLTCLPGPGLAATFTEDFSAGLAHLYWVLEVDPVFSVDDTQGDIRLAKAVGGDHTLKVARVRYRGVLEGDFEFSIAFRDALIDQVDGLPGNQVQLNAVFGGQFLAIVRSDEPAGGGQNHHVFLSPPGTWTGTGTDNSTQGVMRLRRTGALVEAFLNDVLIHSGTYNTLPLTNLSFSLQANGTVDPISVTFDDFSLTADMVTAVDPVLPGPRFEVSYPSPNPTNRSSQLFFDLATPTAMDVTIFDARGRLVRQLLRGEIPAGPNSVAWDGRDGQGRSVAAGIYYYQIQAKDQKSSRPVVILR